MQLMKNLLIAWLVATAALGETKVRNSIVQGAPVQLLDKGADSTGATSSAAAITTAIAALPATGGTVQMPCGLFKISSQIIVTDHVTLQGGGMTQAFAGVNYRACTTILKSGSFDGLRISGNAAGLKDLAVDGDVANSGDGIYATGSNVKLDTVTVMNQGGVGLRIGGKVGGTNANNWYVAHFASYNNGSHGIYLHDVTGAPNVNGGMLASADVRGNVGDGLRVENAILNTIVGLVSQLNTGWGVNAAPSVATQGFNTFVGGDYEANTAGQFQFTANANRNTLIYNGNTAIVNLGFLNTIIWPGIIVGEIRPLTDGSFQQAGALRMNSGVPTNSNGNNGDVYFRTDVPTDPTRIYYVRGGGVWSPFAMIGTSAFANLGTPSNGTVNYCSDCTIANPCAGAGTGAIAKRLNSVWVCN